MSDTTTSPGSASERRLAAIIFTDVVDYSARMQRDETGTMALVRDDFAQMERQAARHGGEVLNTMGDGMLLGFASAVQAVTYALQLQAEFTHRRLMKAAEQTLEHRIGIHVGEVFRQDGRVAGDGVNIAARIQTLAPAGGICVSQSVYDLIKGKITVPVKALGPQELKNIAERMPIFQLMLPGGNAAAPTPRRDRRWIVALAAAGLLVVAAVWFWLSRGATPAAGPIDKSIAVLPFVNRSVDKENEFFTDGTHEDILTNLAHVRELRVVSRTSVMPYRATTKKVPEIGRELHVAYILEGSVQRAGSMVHFTAQLIRAANDEHLWAKSYDRELTAANVFAIQAELAQAIASELQAALSPQEKSLIARRPTGNLAAYDLYLKARDSVNQDAFSQRALQKQESLLQAAVELDPKFAAAWGELAATHVKFLLAKSDVTPARLAKATAAINRATSLEPESPDVIRSAAIYYNLGLNDRARVAEQLERLLRLQPNDADAHRLLGQIQFSEGRYVDSVASHQKAVRLDPVNVEALNDLALLLRRGRRYAEAMMVQRQVIALHAERVEESVTLADLAFCATGSTRESAELAPRLEARDAKSMQTVLLRIKLAVWRGDLTEAIRLDRLQPDPDEEIVQLIFGRTTMMASAYAAHGDTAATGSRFAALRTALGNRLALEPDNTGLMRQLAILEAVLGDKEAALRHVQRAFDLVPPGMMRENARYALAVVLALTGENERAIAELTRALRLPGLANVHELKVFPAFHRLRGDARFEVLVNDPKNNAPLY